MALISFGLAASVAKVKVPSSRISRAARRNAPRAARSHGGLAARKSKHHAKGLFVGEAFVNLGGPVDNPGGSCKPDGFGNHFRCISEAVLEIGTDRQAGG